MQAVSSAKGFPPPTNTPVVSLHVPNKYKLSRVGRKLQISDDPRTVQALPRDVPERAAEILQKEENELVCFEIREELLEAALRIGYEGYMEKQTTFFTVHCTAMAWLQLLDWHFYRHDPGEDPSAYPPCHIPKRTESWIPDDVPAPSNKDSWGRQDLVVVEECPEEPMPQYPSTDDIEMIYVPPIPQQYWFPGKINLITDYTTKDGQKARHVMDEEHKEDVHSTSDSASSPSRMQWDQSRNTSESDWNYEDSSSLGFLESGTLYNSSEVVQKVTNYEPLPRQRTKDPERRRPLVELVSRENGKWHFQQYGSSTESPSIISKIGEESEVLQKVTDYTVEHESSTILEDSRRSSLKPSSPVDGSLQGAGDSRHDSKALRRRSRVKSWSRPRFSMLTKLPPLVADSPSRVSVISDCRLRNLRLETQYEVSAERLDTSERETTRRK